MGDGKMLLLDLNQEGIWNPQALLGRWKMILLIKAGHFAPHPTCAWNKTVLHESLHSAAASLVGSGDCCSSDPSKAHPSTARAAHSPGDTPSIPAASCTPHTGAGLHVSTDSFHLAKVLGLSWGCPQPELFLLLSIGAQSLTPPAACRASASHCLLRAPDLAPGRSVRPGWAALSGNTKGKKTASLSVCCDLQHKPLNMWLPLDCAQRSVEGKQRTDRCINDQKWSNTPLPQISAMVVKRPLSTCRWVAGTQHFKQPSSLAAVLPAWLGVSLQDCPRYQPGEHGAS